MKPIRANRLWHGATSTATNRSPDATADQNITKRKADQHKSAPVRLEIPALPGFVGGENLQDQILSTEENCATRLRKNWWSRDFPILEHKWHSVDCRMDGAKWDTPLKGSEMNFFVGSSNDRLALQPIAQGSTDASLQAKRANC